MPILRDGNINWIVSSVALINMSISQLLGQSRGLVVKGEDSQLSGCGFESRRRIQDGVSEASYYYIGKRNKGSQMGHTKKLKKKEKKASVSCRLKSKDHDWVKNHNVWCFFVCYHLHSLVILPPFILITVTNNLFYSLHCFVVYK